MFWVTNNSIKSFGKLRKKAEDVLEHRIHQSSKLYELDELIHELEVHQIELEMQNEELIKTQLELQESRDKYFQLFDFAPVGYFTLDASWIIKTANLKGSSLLRTPRKYLINQFFLNFVAPDYREKFHNQCQEVVKRQDKNQCEVKIVTKDEKTLFLSLDINVVRSEGKFKELRIATSDITKRKQNEEDLKLRSEELAQSNADLKQFAYVASHDLREPLRVITSFSQLLERRYKDQLDEDANQFINFVVDGAKRLDVMILDLLEYSQLANKEMLYTDVNMQEVIEQVITNLNVLIEKNNVQITYKPLPIVKADENMMIRLLQNLIENAIKYRREENPNIYISADKQDDEFIFNVKDNGIGIDPNHLDRIFTIFKRLHTHEEYEGTGIGLALAQTIVHQHGGEIWAESEPGKGSTFHFTIPESH